jgi:hypothetical protein
MTDFPVPGRLCFPNGYAIDVHEIWKGQVLYQVWPPGVESQSMGERLARMPVADFEEAVRENMQIATAVVDEPE